MPMQDGSDTTIEKLWALASDDALDCLLEVACRSLQASGSVLSYVISARQRVRHAPERPDLKPDQYLSELQRALCRQVFDADALVVANSVEAHPDLSRGARSGAAIAAFIGVPVHRPDGQVLGTLGVHDRQTRAWTARDLELLTRLAASAVARIEQCDGSRQGMEADAHDGFAAAADNIPGLVFERRKTGDTSWTYRFFGLSKQKLSSVAGLSGSGEELEFIHEDDRARVRDALSQATRDETNLNLTFRAAAEGAVRWLRSQSVVRHEADGTAVWDGLCFEISDLVTARDAAEAACVAQDTLLVDVNHELRAPLQAIVGFAELLKTETEPSVVRDHAAIIQNSAQSLLAIANQLLDVASGQDQAGQPDRSRPVEIRTFAKGCHDMIAPLAREKDLASSVLVDPDVPVMATLDEPKVQQVLVNFLNNAIKFTEAGSIGLHVSRQRNGLRFSVSDTGIGIAGDQIDRLFQRFVRLEEDQRSSRGSGIGLAIAKRLVEEMDGTIGVTSRPARGTTFWVELGAATLAGVDDPTGNTQDPPQSGGARILLADDLDLNRKLIADMLSLEGHEVDCVCDGAAAVRAASSHVYDVILMDMVMPVMDGITATRAIRTLPSPACNVPIIALTAHAFKEQLDSCLAAGMDATLTKPMSFETLNTAVQNWVHGRSQAA